MHHLFFLNLHIRWSLSHQGIHATFFLQNWSALQVTGQYDIQSLWKRIFDLLQQSVLSRIYTMARLLLRYITGAAIVCQRKDFCSVLFQNYKPRYFTKTPYVALPSCRFPVVEQTMRPCSLKYISSLSYALLSKMCLSILSLYSSLTFPNPQKFLQKNIAAITLIWTFLSMP